YTPNSLYIYIYIYIHTHTHRLTDISLRMYYAFSFSLNVVFLLFLGNRPPGMVPNKFNYMTTEDFAGRLMKPQVNRGGSNVFEAMFEKGTLNAMRFVTAVAEMGKQGDVLVERVSRELWKIIWRTDQDITQPASLTEAGLKAGLSPIKYKLKSVTEEALEHKRFGFPCTVCYVNGKAEVFFGSDRFELMAHCIGEKWVWPQPAKPTAKM
uniref:DSBA-like thioredoxin domain-containing protein n=1 Tax=Sinocyclocheilus grahami TaxID=75366 RepID=A0A672R645_SINGR